MKFELTVVYYNGAEIIHKVESPDFGCLLSLLHVKADQVYPLVEGKGCVIAGNPAIQIVEE